MWNDLALVDARTAEEASPQKSAPVPRSEVPWQLVVLVVDDDLVDTWLTVSALRTDPRVRRVVSADSPDEILTQLVHGDLRPNLVLLDINMPKVDGFKFIDALREIPTMSRTPVVMLTTSRFVQDVKTARTKQVRGYVIKPDRYEDLCQRLSGVVSSIMSDWR